MGKERLNSDANLFGIVWIKKSKVRSGIWIDKKQQTSWGFYDYDLKEYTCIVPKIQDIF